MEYALEILMVADAGLAIDAAAGFSKPASPFLWRLQIEN